MAECRYLLTIGVAATVMLAGSGCAHAAALDKLRGFLDGTQSASGNFSQTVTGKSGRKPQQASGTLAFARPGKFRWTYDKPYYQLIVGDGEKLWVYDRDLNQVSVRKLGQALGSTPAALLAGDNTLERNFELSEGGAADGLEWVNATPKSRDTGFERLRLGFSADGSLKRMELADGFGQLTTLFFGELARNVRPDPGLFRFTPPQGADVVGE